jgi:hypothetical protein
MYILTETALTSVCGGSTLDGAAGVFAETAGGAEAGAFATGVMEGAELGSLAGPVGIAVGALAAAAIFYVWEVTA